MRLLIQKNPFTPNLPNTTVWLVAYNTSHLFPDPITPRYPSLANTMNCGCTFEIIRRVFFLKISLNCVWSESLRSFSCAELRRYYQIYKAWAIGIRNETRHPPGTVKRTPVQAYATTLQSNKIREIEILNDFRDRPGCGKGQKSANVTLEKWNRSQIQTRHNLLLGEKMNNPCLDLLMVFIN